MPSRHELVAHNRTPDEIAHAIGADLVIFQTLPDLVASVRQFNPALTSFDCSVFTGEYVTGGVDEAYLKSLEGLRADNVKSAVAESGALGAMEGKGGGALKREDQPGESKEMALGCSGPMNGADSTVGLHNSYLLS